MRTEKQIKAWRRNFALFILSGICSNLLTLMRTIRYENVPVAPSDICAIYIRLLFILDKLRKTKVDQW